MQHTTTVIIGGGQAGLAMSRCLSDLGVEHIVLERGQLAERWRSQTWDSLRLLTPNWMTRLPGFQYDGPDPDGFMSAPELIAFFERYAAESRAPVHTDTTVLSVDRSDDGFRVLTNRDVWSAESVVVATGYCDLPAVPAAGRRLPPSIVQIVPGDYRRPDDLPAGGALVVGASSTGAQLADEIQKSGRQVTLAVGRHTRLPRCYRGHDILWWLDRVGMFSQHADAVAAIDVSRNQPSLQLVGNPQCRSLDLAALHADGVRLVGRIVDFDSHRASLADDLVATTSAADIKMAQTLGQIDEFIARTGTAAPAPGPFYPTWPLAADASDILDLKAERIETVIWATGYRREYPWLHVPVLDRKGEINHVAGTTPAFGLYVLGMRFQRRRNSSFIDGVGDDAWVIAHQIARSAGVRVA